MPQSISLTSSHFPSILRLHGAMQIAYKAFQNIDPRYYQIAALGTFLFYGILQLEFQVSFLQICITFLSCLITQWLWQTKIIHQPLELRSALITSCSLCLLLRSNSLLWIAVAGAIAMSCKFIFYWRGKHWFNPANGVIALLLLFQVPIWVSPGQWGNPALFAFLLMGLGFLVVTRAQSWDLTVGFLLLWGFLLVQRSYFLGEPMTIPLHRLHSGGLLLFSFFMISDPRSTPNSRLGRMIFIIITATIAYYIQFKYFRTNGLMYGLFFASCCGPLIEKLLPGNHFTWNNS